MSVQGITQLIFAHVGTPTDMANLGSSNLINNCRVLTEILAQSGREFSKATFRSYEHRSQFVAIVGDEKDPELVWTRMDGARYVNIIRIAGEEYFWRSFTEMDPAERMALIVFAPGRAYKQVPKNFYKLWI